MKVRLVAHLVEWMFKTRPWHGMVAKNQNTHKDQWNSRVSSQIHKFLINHLYNLESGKRELVFMDYQRGNLKALLVVYRVDHHVPIDVNAVLD